MLKIRVKGLTREIVSLTEQMGFEAVPEYRTPDGTRVDIAVLKFDEKVLAIELEASFKWFPQRLLYDVVKAYRAGFPEVWVVSNFKSNPGWIMSYALELGIELRILKEKEVIERLKARLARL